jgi:hypothetical protein
LKICFPTFPCTAGLALPFQSNTILLQASTKSLPLTTWVLWKSKLPCFPLVGTASNHYPSSSPNNFCHLLQTCTFAGSTFFFLLSSLPHLLLVIFWVIYLSGSAAVIQEIWAMVLLLFAAGCCSSLCSSFRFAGWSVPRRCCWVWFFYIALLSVLLSSLLGLFSLLRWSVQKRHYCC